MTEPRYSEKATTEWIEWLSQDIAERVINTVKANCFSDNSGIKSSINPTTRDIIVQNKALLAKLSRGFIAEFLRQTRDHIPDLNEPSQFTDADTAYCENRPGVLHASATLKKLLELGIPSTEAQWILGKNIKLCVARFGQEYLRVDPRHTPEASIKLKSLGEIVKRAQAAIDAKDTNGVKR